MNTDVHRFFLHVRLIPDRSSVFICVNLWFSNSIIYFVKTAIKKPGVARLAKKKPLDWCSLIFGGLAIVSSEALDVDP
jgi:hypothetical protein